MRIIGITVGDPASTDPEITAKALSDLSVYERCKPLVVGDVPVMGEALKVTGLSGKPKIHTAGNVNEVVFKYDIIDACHMDMVDMDKPWRGRVSAMVGDVAFQYAKKIIGLAMDHRTDATVTNVLNKETMNLTGHRYFGHIEIYIDYIETREYTMMLAHEDLRVVHVFTHVSLREAYGHVRRDCILKVIRIAYQACRRLDIFQPRIGAAGLNPHSGENGMLGKEEIEEITPATQAVRDEGIQTDGLVPPDTILSKARGGWHDIVVVTCHDQGYIPLKVVGFVCNQEGQKWDTVAGVNTMPGLPIIRAFVDHGAAFDQAGTGLASEFSLTNAMGCAIRMAETKEIE